MQIKKRLSRKTQLVTTMVLVCFLSSFSFVHALEYAPHNYNFTHGNMQQQVYVADATALYEVSGGVIGTDMVEVDICNVMNITLDNYYSGTITLKFSYSSGTWQQDPSTWNYIVEGGTIDAIVYSSGTFRIKVYDQDSVQIIMHCSRSILASNLGNSLDPYFKWTSVSSSLTAETNHNNVYDNVKSIDTRLTTANTNLSTIIARLETANGIFNDIYTDTDAIKSYIQNIYNQNNDGNYSTDVETLLNNLATHTSTIDTNVANCSTKLNTVASKVSVIQQAIGAIDILNSQDSILDCINTIADAQDDIVLSLTDIYTSLTTISNNQTTIINKLTSMGADISSIASTITSVNTTAGNIYSALLSMKTTLESYGQYIDNIESLITTQNNLISNIDSLIDKITWSNFNANYIGYSNDLVNFSTENNVVVNNYFYCFKFTDSTYAMSNKYIFKVTLYVDKLNINNNTISNLYFYYDTNHIRVIEPLYINTNRFYTEVYFMFDTDSYQFTAPFGIAVMFQQSRQSDLNNRIQIIDSNDIEYWTLLNYFEEIKQYQTVNNFDSLLYSKLNDIIDAINNINLSVNVSDQDINNVTNNFDTDITTIHNIENNYGLNFDLWDDQLTSNDIALDLSPYSSTIQLYKSNITSLWSNPFVSLPCLLSAIAFVFLIILG